MQKKAQVKFKNKETTDFFPVLKKRIDQYFIDNKISKYGDWRMYSKSFILLSLYIIPLVACYAIPMSPALYLSLFVFMGFGISGIGMSVMHDANHGSYSSNSTVNTIMGHTINLLGGSVHNWKLQHNILHHTYTNIHEMDDDIEDKLILRFSPYGDRKWYHKFQVVYVFLFYSILTIYWALLKDLVQLIKYHNNGVDSNKGTTRFWVFVKITVAKIFYFYFMLYFPIAVLDLPATMVVTGFLLMHATAGLVLSVIFQLAHTVEGTSHPLPDDRGLIENDWAIHQLNTTANFSRNNFFLTWYLGGLNYQVEHHLFPRICHVHYPEISKIVERTANEYNVPYIENESFGGAFKSHLNLLWKFGVGNAPKAT